MSLNSHEYLNANNIKTSIIIINISSVIDVFFILLFKIELSMIVKILPGIIISTTILTFNHANTSESKLGRIKYKILIIEVKAIRMNK